MQTASTGFFPQIALGPADAIHIAFVDAATNGVRHGVWTGSGFAIDAVPITINPLSDNIALAIDHGGAPAILAIAAGSTVPGAIRLWRPIAGGWSDERVPTAGSAIGRLEATAWLAFDAADKPHVFFQDSSTFSSQLRLAWKP
jgi:hypothetical protein